MTCCLGKDKAVVNRSYLTDGRIGVSRRAWDLIAEYAYSVELAAYSGLVSKAFGVAIDGAPVWQQAWIELQRERDRSLRYFMLGVEWDYARNEAYESDYIEEEDDEREEFDDDDDDATLSESNTASIASEDSDNFYFNDTIEEFQADDGFAYPLFEKARRRIPRPPSENVHWISCGIEEEEYRSNAVETKNKIENKSARVLLATSQECGHVTQLKFALLQWEACEKGQRKDALSFLRQSIQSKVFITVESSTSFCQSLVEISIRGHITLRITYAAHEEGECFVVSFRSPESNNNLWQYPIHLDATCGLLLNAPDHRLASRVYRLDLLDSLLTAIFGHRPPLEANDALHFIFLAAGIQPVLDNVFESPRYFSIFAQALEAIKTGELDVVQDVVYGTLESAIYGSAALAWSNALRAQPPDLRPFHTLLVFDLLAHPDFTWKSQNTNQSLTSTTGQAEIQLSDPKPNASGIFLDSPITWIFTWIFRLWTRHKYLILLLFRGGEGEKRYDNYHTNFLKYVLPPQPFTAIDSACDPTLKHYQHRLDVPPRLLDSIPEEISQRDSAHSTTLSS